jgi:acyl carrier protein
MKTPGGQTTGHLTPLVMNNPNKYQTIIFQAIDQVNEVLPGADNVCKEAGTILLGEGAQLDSMGFVNFVVALEDLLSGDGLNISLMEEIHARGDEVPTIMTVENLAGFLLVLAQSKGSAGN